MAFDVTPLIGPRTGVGHVTAALLSHLAARPDVRLVAYAVTRDRSHATSLTLPPGVALRVTGVPARALFTAWSRAPAPRIDRWTGPVDVVHGTNFVVPPAHAGGVVTVHDVAFARDPHLVTAASRRYTGLLRAAIRRGAAVHVFSEAVGDEVVTLLDCPSELVVCIRPGIADTGGGDPGRGRTIAGSDRFVLALGTVEPRKNLPRLVEAFDRVAADDPALRLVVAGPDGWGSAAFADAVAAARHGDRVVRLGYVSDADRRDLLAGARVLAYPSLDEGFGHPPLEAMRAGTPVVAAAAGSLPEVLGDAAVLCDPQSVGDLADALFTVCDDDDVRARLITAGLARAQRWSWDAAATGLTALYRRVAAAYGT